MDPASTLNQRIEARTARLTIVGQGYVGLPVAVEFAATAFSVTGLDTDPDRVAALSFGRSCSPDVTNADLMALLREGRYQATTDFGVPERSDVVIICVPTPLRKSKDPDIAYVAAAGEAVAARFRPGQLVVLESTTYPGTTDELLLPMFLARRARIGEDLFLAFSPERIDPGNSLFKVRDIPRVVGGVTPACTRLAAALYSKVVPRVHEVSSPKVAELAKLYENVFRNVNIALADDINREVPGHVVTVVIEALNDVGRPLKGARILVLGVAYVDPHVPTFEILHQADCVLILTDHPEFDYRRIVEVAPLVMDTRNATWGITAPGRVVRF